MIQAEDRALIEKTARECGRKLDANYRGGFGIFPSSDPDSNYFDQVWTRDVAHASARYFAKAQPQAVVDSLRTVFNYQRQNGELPLRVERNYLVLKLIPGLRWLSLPLFNIVECRFRKRTERPVYEGQDLSGGEDTVPAVLMAAGGLFDASGEGRAFVRDMFPKLKSAAEFFRTRIDPEDGLAVIAHINADWTDTIKRTGKLSLINIWWWRGLGRMEMIAREIGDEAYAESCRTESEKVKKAIMEKLYDADGGFFRTKPDDRRLDTTASIFGARYFLNAGEAVRLEETLHRRAGHSSGLQNFSPLYEPRDIDWTHRLTGQWGYHNKFVWPWVTLENSFVKIKIAREHADPAVRANYAREVIGDLLNMARLFEKAGGAYEIFEPDEARPGGTFFYKPPRDFMGSMAAFVGVYEKAKAAGLV